MVMHFAPVISNFMTPVPRTIGYDQTLRDAANYMRKLHVRSLAVTRGGQPIGVLTERDVYFLIRILGEQVLDRRVEQVVALKPFITGPDCSLSEAAEKLISGQHDCVLVMENDGLVGVFTADDVLRAVAKIFKSELKAI